MGFTEARDSEWQWPAGPYANLHLAVDRDSTSPLLFHNAL